MQCLLNPVGKIHHKVFTAFSASERERKLWCGRWEVVADIAKVKGQERFDWSVVLGDRRSLNNLPNYSRYTARVILTKELTFSLLLPFLNCLAGHYF